MQRSNVKYLKSIQKKFFFHLTYVVISLSAFNVLMLNDNIFLINPITLDDYVDDVDKGGHGANVKLMYQVDRLYAMGEALRQSIFRYFFMGIFIVVKSF